MKALLLALSLLSTPALADTLVDNVNGVEVDRAGQLQHFTGLLVGTDGKVVQLLRPGDPRPRRVDFRVDGRGRALLPGLIDAHGQLMRLGLGLLGLDAKGLAQRGLTEPLAVQRDQALDAAQRALLAAGLTSVADMGTSIADWSALRRMGDAGRLQLRVISYALGIEPLLNIAGTKPTPWLYGDRLRMVGVMLNADSALGPRDPSPRDSKLKNLASRAAMDHFQVAVEVADDAANAQAILAFEELSRTYGNDRRWRIEQAARDDHSALAPNPFARIAAALAPADSRATLAKALASFTRDAAYAGQAEDRLGSLDPGHFADFIIVDRDITTAAPTDIAATKVLETWMAGRKVYDRPPGAAAPPAR